MSLTSAPAGDELHVLATLLCRNHLRWHRTGGPHSRCGRCGDRVTSVRSRVTSKPATSSPEPGHYTDRHINKFVHAINRCDIVKKHI